MSICMYAIVGIVASLPTLPVMDSLLRSCCLHVLTHVVIRSSSRLARVVSLVVSWLSLSCRCLFRCHVLSSLMYSCVPCLFRSICNDAVVIYRAAQLLFRYFFIRFFISLMVYVLIPCRRSFSILNGFRSLATYCLYACMSVYMSSYLYSLPTPCCFVRIPLCMYTNVSFVMCFCLYVCLYCIIRYVFRFFLHISIHALRPLVCPSFLPLLIEWCASLVKYVVIVCVQYCARCLCLYLFQCLHPFDY